MRSSRILLSATVLASAVIGAGCVAPLLESLEEPLIFRPKALDVRDARALVHPNQIEEVRLAVASARKVRAAILATPFDSAAALGEEHFHWLPFPFARVMQSRYNPGLMAPMISVPALFLLAEKDDVTPVKNGMALAQRWGGAV